MCGEIPVFPNMNMRPENTESGPNQTIQIICKEGYRSVIDHLTCLGGEWDSKGSPLKNICKRESSSVVFYQVLLIIKSVLDLC